VGKHSVWVEPKKIKVMQDWTHPKNIKILHGFMGLTSYYRKFVKNYGKNASHLTALLKNNSFTWTLENDQSFQALKDIMWTTFILAILDFTKTSLLECDASKKGIGAVLMKHG